MSDYSIANLRTLEDLAERHGFGDSQEMRSANETLGVEQVERRDVERGGHRDPTAPVGQAPGEIEPRRAVVEASVDVG